MMVSRRKDAPARRVTAVLAAGVAAALAWAAPQASASGGAAVRASGATANAIVAPGGLYEIVAIQGTPTGAKCVDVINGSTAPGARLQIFHCHGSDRNGAVQLFSFIDMGNGFYQVSNKNSHLCFELPNSSGADGTEIEQADCLGFGGQQWEIRVLYNAVGVGPVFGLVNEAFPTKCLTWQGGALPADNNRLVMSECVLPTSATDTHVNP